MMGLIHCVFVIGGGYGGFCGEVVVVVAAVSVSVYVGVDVEMHSGIEIFLVEILNFLSNNHELLLKILY